MLIGGMTVRIVTCYIPETHMGQDALLPAMFMSRSLRSNVALGLLFNILVLTFACGMSGTGEGHAHPGSAWVPLCSLEGGSYVDLSSDLVGAGHGHSEAMSFDCPVCQSASLLLLMVIVLLLRKVLSSQPFRVPPPTWLPRHAWPPANPRAP